MHTYPCTDVTETQISTKTRQTINTLVAELTISERGSVAEGSLVGLSGVLRLGLDGGSLSGGGGLGGSVGLRSGHCDNCVCT
jgi:hypothetical protein